jgi:hypothetical protein
MQDDFSLTIFVRGGWTDSINFVKNMIAEIFSMKAMSFWKNLDKGETERGQENVTVRNLIVAGNLIGPPVSRKKSETE